MSSFVRKVQKNAEQNMIDNFYKNMTPDQYREAVRVAIKKTEEDLTRRYNEDLKHMADQYNQAIRENTLIAMDTLATEMIYELGNVLECYVDEPEYLDQKIDIVQNIYETAMHSIEDYASKKYKTDKHAQKVFEKKKKTIQKIFGMTESGEENGKKKSK